MKQTLLNLFVILFSSSLFAQLTHYDWPTGSGEAILSDKYDIYVKNGSNPEVKLEVLMSIADPNDIQYDFQKNELTGRTFSFATISYDKLTGSGLTFRVVKKFGGTSSNVEIVPKSYKITPTIGANEVSFNINETNKFISINFKDSANETDQKKWIKHMLTIFIDQPEVNIPNPTDAGVVVYSPSTTPTALQNASIIYFQPGYYNLKNYQYQGSKIDSDGIIYLEDGQKMYMAGGAFIEGLVSRKNYNNTNQKLYGRGVLSGRQYEWQDANGNKPYGEIVLLGKFAEINGVHLIESPKHGVVSPEGMFVENLKFLGWHANNDALRVGNGSEIKNSFIRAVDDFFYNYNNFIHDCVFWAGHNGAIVTFGWASYDTGSSFIENIDIINPEWIGLGNNNSLIASQVNLDFNPIDYGTGSTTTTFKNIRIEGSIPGLLNVKPRSSSNGIPEAEKVLVSELGYLGDIHFEDITIENQFDKGRIRGQANATTTGNNTYFTKNIKFTNITIGGKKLTETNKSIYFDIDTATTQNIVFDPGNASEKSELTIENFSSNVTIHRLSTPVPSTTNKGITNEDISTITPGSGKWFAGDYNLSEGEFGIQTSGGNTGSYLSRVSPTEFARGVAYVFNNRDRDAYGFLNMSFDYFWKSPLTADRISYRVWGIKDPEKNGIDGYFRLTGGSGAFGDNDATNYVNGTDGTQLAGTTELGVAESWTNITYLIDATPYDYIVIVFGGAFQTVQNSPTTVFGLDNVSIPKTNPLAYSDKIAIPSLFQAEDFTTNNSALIETTTDVDGGDNLQFSLATNWTDYEVYVHESITYKVELRVSAATNFSFDVMSNSVLIKTITGEATGDLQTWKTIKTTLNLNEGLQTIRITNSNNSWNLNWLKFSVLDSDKDGVENEFDACPDTPLGSKVDEKGCLIFSVSPTNFSIKAVSETCKNKNNGQITISAVEDYTYKTTINGANYTFTKDSPLVVDNLAPSTYDFCILIEGKSYTQCFSVKLEPGTTLSGKASTSASKTTIEIEKGTAPFKVLLNGEELFETSSPMFEINTHYGDLIQVVSSKKCEGVFNKSITEYGSLTAYPNPTSGLVTIDLPNSKNEIGIAIYTMQSHLVSSKMYVVTNGKATIDLGNYPVGVYILKIQLDKPISLKLVKN